MGNQPGALGSGFQQQPHRLRGLMQNPHFGGMQMPHLMQQMRRHMHPQATTPAAPAAAPAAPGAATAAPAAPGQGNPRLQRRIGREEAQIGRQQQRIGREQGRLQGMQGTPGIGGMKGGQPHRAARLERRIGRQEGRIGREQARVGRQQARLGGVGQGAPGGPGAPGTTPAAATPGTTPPAPSPQGQTGPQTFQDWINSTFGAGSPFGMRGNYSDPNNPIFDAARRNYQQGLAGTRARYGASGLGNSSREALAEGEGAADFGAQVAQIGEQAFQSDAGRALQAALGGQQNLLGLNAQLGNLGNQLTGIGAAEQQIPGLGGLLSLLSTFGPALSTGTTGTHQKSHLF